MKILNFIYIEEDRNLKQVGVRLNNQFCFDYCASGHRLVIKPNNDFISNFWGEKISSLAAIVGNNGAGKSNLIRYIIEHVIEGRSGDVPNGFLLYRDGSRWYCYSGIGDIDIVDGKGNKINYTEVKRNPDIRTYYYTSHVQFVDGILSQELSGFTNTSDVLLLKKSVTELYNMDTMSGLSFMQHANSFIVQSQMRMSLLAAHFGNKLRNMGFHVPRYVLLASNKSALISHNLKCTPQERLKQDTFAVRQRPQKFSIALLSVIYNSIVSQYREHLNEVPSELHFALVDMDIESMEIKEVIMQIVQNYRKLSYEFVSKLLSLCYSIEANFNKGDNHYWLDISTKEGIEKLSSFIDTYYETSDFLTARFFDMCLSDSYFQLAPMSSGEYNLFNLLSRLYFSQHYCPKKFSSSYPSELIILDETELGLHPEWQRNYISMLTRCLNTEEFAPNPVQVVITSHSPIILSDIPRQNTVYLKKDQDGSTHVSDEQEETFASNVFDLYRNSFFMEEGLIGEFASSKLEEIDKAIAAGSELTADQKKTIEQIGDKRLRNYFCRQLDIDSRIAAHNNEIERLKKLKEEQHVQD